MEFKKTHVNLTYPTSFQDSTSFPKFDTPEINQATLIAYVSGKIRVSVHLLTPFSQLFFQYLLTNKLARLVSNFL